MSRTFTHDVDFKLNHNHRLSGVIKILRINEFPNTLEALVAGKSIAQFEALSDAQLTDDFMWFLEKFIGKPLPRPSTLKRTHWMSNRNFLGSYSYLSMASEINELTPKDLAETLLNAQNEPKILFAGEATDETHSSYSHGAVSSGWRAAKELVKFYLSKSD